MSKLADIIIPHHDRHDLLRDCLACIPYDLFNVIVVSGGTFAKNCNKGARLAETENLIFLNDDTRPNVEVLKKMCGAEEDLVGISEEFDLGLKHIKTSGIKYEVKNGFPVGRFAESVSTARIPNGFCFRVKKSAWEKLGGFDERFITGYEDNDLGLRAIEAGMSFHFFLDKITHLHSQSEGRNDYNFDNRERFYEKWNYGKIKKVLGLRGEKLRILIANNHLARLGGSETFTHTLAREMRERGHDVDVFTFSSGEMSKKIKCVEKLKKEYDLLLISHNTCLRFLQDVKGFKILTCHGKYPDLEQPEQGADAYVAISEEVQKHLSNRGYGSKIIWNGIDCVRFSPQKPINKKLQKVLSLARTEHANNIVMLACKSLGVDLEVLQPNTWNVEKKMQDADLVVSLGRGAMEAMACGRAVIVFDARGYMRFESRGDGIIDGNAEELLRCNFSGRRYNIPFTPETLAKEMQKYRQDMGKTNRLFAVKHLNVRYQTEKYFSFYNQSEKKGDRVFKFIDSSTTEYGIAKYLEKELVRHGCRVGEGGVTLCYANDLGKHCHQNNKEQTPDNHLPLRRAVNSKADYVFYSQKISEKWFKKDNFYLPSGFDEMLFDREVKKRDVEIGFVGKSLWHSRSVFLQRVHEKYGSRFVYKNDIYFKDMADFYSRCKIVLNWAGAEEITMRLFEGTAAGALVITNRVPHLEDFFVEGKEIIAVDNYRQLFSTIDFYLTNTKEREQIAREGQRRAFADHTYRQRAEEIIRTVWNTQAKD